MRLWITAPLIVVGLIHLLPLAGVLGAERLAQLYGIDMGEPNLAVLMRHRAVLFGLLGAFCIAAAFVPALRPWALVAGAISVVSFLALAALAPGGVNPQLARVVTADWIALACLAVAGAAWALQRR